MGEKRALVTVRKTGVEFYLLKISATKTAFHTFRAQHVQALTQSQQLVGAHHFCKGSKGAATSRRRALPCPRPFPHQGRFQVSMSSEQFRHLNGSSLLFAFVDPYLMPQGPAVCSPLLSA
jgi:hypothetical protein